MKKEGKMSISINDFVPLMITLLICGVGLFAYIHDNAIDRKNKKSEKDS